MHRRTQTDPLIDRLQRALAGKYAVESEIASGGMGTVYRGFDLSLERPVAIKVLLPELATARGAERFLREARTLARLSHPNVIPIHEVGEGEGLFYYVMDFVDGPTLDSLLQKGALPPEKALATGTQLLQAVGAVHEAGVIHRDIKPSNIFLAGDHLLLGDFGIAKPREDRGETLTGIDETVGTPGYMAPEMRSGGQATESSDLYMAAVVLFEALTGRRWGFHDQLSDADWGGIPRPLRRPLGRGLLWDPRLRWTEAASFERALSKAAAQAGFETVSGGGGRLARFAAPRRLWLAAGSLVVVGLLLAALWIASRASREESESTDSAAVALVPVSPDAISLAVLPCEYLGGEPEGQRLAQGLAIDLSTALAGVQGVRTAGPRSTSMLQTEPIQAIAESLGTANILWCSVQPEEGEYRISATLYDAAGVSQWAERFDRTGSDLLAMQEEVVSRIVETLEIRLGADDRLVRSRTANQDAHNLYLKGLWAWDQRSRPSLGMAVNYFQQAIELDPEYAAAYAGLAAVQASLSGRGLEEPGTAFERARQYSLQALELDVSLAEAHAVLAEVGHWYDWDFDAARAGYLTALELNPNGAFIRLWFAKHLASGGEFDEAIRQATYAAEWLDRYSPAMRTGLGEILVHQGEYAEASRHLARALELDPAFAEAGLWLLAAQLGLGQTAEVLEGLGQIEMQTRGSPSTYRAAIAYGFAMASDTARARSLLESLEGHPADVYVSPFWIGLGHAALGDLDEAIGWMEQAIERRDEFVVWLQASSLVEPLRSHPRFHELVGQVWDPS
jgi:TolB-like protein/Tfp pilus assembly protein PilF